MLGKLCGTIYVHKNESASMLKQEFFELIAYDKMDISKQHISHFISH